MPTTDRSSPTTTSAVNEKRRPPLTTFATRFISTTRSCRSTWPGVTDRCRAIERLRLEPESRLPGALGQRAHAPVVAVAAAVEHAGVGAGVLGALREQLAGALGLLHPGKRLEVGLGPVDRGDRAACHVVDQLRLHAAVRAEHRQPRPLGRAAHLRADAAAPAQPLCVLRLDAHARLPTFRATYSPAYRMPFPL